jgi:hypothetical protein
MSRAAHLFAGVTLTAMLAVIAPFAMLAAASPVAAATVESPTRPEYVARLEQICKPGSEATQRAVQGIRPDVRLERFAIAATKFARAKRIFAHTVRAISTVPRPADDTRTLARWFGDLGRETDYLGRIATSLRTSNIAGFQRVSAQFIHQGNRANNVVISFGFIYCSFKPSRFQ